jgi:looped-hinge helix DNA binding domain, AbrB family
MGGKVSSQGQITVPKEVRDALGIEAGDELEFEVVGDHFIGRKKAPQRRWAHLIGMFKDGRTSDEILRQVRPHRAWDDQ